MPERVGATMRLWRIEPKMMNAVRVDTHFFECDRCGFATSEDISRIKQSDAASGFAFVCSATAA